MREQIEQQLDSLTQECSDNATLVKAARSILLAPAKRLRPLIVLEIVNAYIGSATRAHTTACALEILHTYTLIHDDLPCMDDAETRRGILAAHQAYGEATALLAGDYLLTRAFEILAHDPSTTNAEKVALVQRFSHLSGGSGLIEGQYFDMTLTKESASEKNYLEMIEKKTAYLFCLAAECSIILGAIEESDAKALSKFGRLFGCAFQLVDDLDDYKSEPDKLSAISLWGSEETLRRIETMVGEMRAGLETLSRPVPYLTMLTETLEAKSLQL